MPAAPFQRIAPRGQAVTADQVRALIADARPAVTHGEHIRKIGYHCRDYFLKQWDKFKDEPWGTLAHSTHVHGIGTYDEKTGIETPRIRVTLATGLSEAQCREIPQLAHYRRRILRQPRARLPRPQGRRTPLPPPPEARLGRRQAVGQNRPHPPR